MLEVPHEKHPESLQEFSPFDIMEDILTDVDHRLYGGDVRGQYPALDSPLWRVQWQSLAGCFVSLNIGSQTTTNLGQRIAC